MAKRFEGFHENEDLPIKRGDVVTIPKGTKISTTMSNKREKIAGRTFKVKVDHVLNGSSTSERVWDATWDTYVEVRTHVNNPSVRWAGEGGYWHEVDINDVPEANK